MKARPLIPHRDRRLMERLWARPRIHPGADWDAAQRCAGKGWARIIPPPVSGAVITEEGAAVMYKQLRRELDRKLSFVRTRAVEQAS